jgi:hypothetical protein
VEQPFQSNGRETTCIHIGGGGISGAVQVTNNRNQLRNCLIDCAITNGDSAPQIPVESLVFEALQARLETLTQHDLKKGDRVRIRGAGALDNVYAVSGDSRKEDL